MCVTDSLNSCFPLVQSTEEMPVDLSLERFLWFHSLREPQIRSLYDDNLTLALHRCYNCTSHIQDATTAHHIYKMLTFMEVRCIILHRHFLYFANMSWKVCFPILTLLSDLNVTILHPCYLLYFYGFSLCPLRHFYNDLSTHWLMPQTDLYR